MMAPATIVSAGMVSDGLIFNVALGISVVGPPSIVVQPASASATVAAVMGTATRAVSGAS